MLNTLPGSAKYSQQRQRYLEAPRCNVVGCTSAHRYLTASGAMFCFMHWGHYLAVKVVQYLHQQAMIDAIKKRQDFDNSALKQRVLEVCSMSNDEIIMLLTEYNTIMSLVDDINIGGQYGNINHL